MDDGSMGRLILPEEQIELLRECWDKVLLGGEAQAGLLFFKNIFNASNDVAKLFGFVDSSQPSTFASLASNEELVKHAVGVVRTVSAVIHMLEEDELLMPVLKDLGARHQIYSVKAEHYAVVGGAFLETLRQALREEFTDEVRQAFAVLWDRVIAGFMQDCDVETLRQARCDINEQFVDEGVDDQADPLNSAFVAHWTREFVRLSSTDLPPDEGETTWPGDD